MLLSWIESPVINDGNGTACDRWLLIECKGEVGHIIRACIAIAIKGHPALLHANSNRTSRKVQVKILALQLKSNGETGSARFTNGGSCFTDNHDILELQACDRTLKTLIADKEVDFKAKILFQLRLKIEESLDPIGSQRRTTGTGSNARIDPIGFRYGIKNAIDRHLDLDHILTTANCLGANRIQELAIGRITDRTTTRLEGILGEGRRRFADQQGWVVVIEEGINLAVLITNTSVDSKVCHRRHLHGAYGTGINKLVQEIQAINSCPNHLRQGG